MPVSALDTVWPGNLDPVSRFCQVFTQLCCTYGTLKAQPLGRTLFVDWGNAFKLYQADENMESEFTH